MILHTQPNKPWNKYDFLLLEAYQILQDELCPQCGMPRYLCGSWDDDLHFRVRVEECDAIVAVKKAQDLREKQKKDPTGVVLVPQPYSEEGRELSSFRKPYYEALRARRLTEQES